MEDLYPAVYEFLVSAGLVKSAAKFAKESGVDIEQKPKKTLLQLYEKSKRKEKAASEVSEPVAEQIAVPPAAKKPKIVEAVAVQTIKTKKSAIPVVASVEEEDDDASAASINFYCIF